MEEKGVAALLIPAAGGPGLMGMAKYFTNVVLWAGRAYVILAAEEETPVIVQWSGYGATWNRQEAVDSRVETSRDSDAFGHALTIMRSLVPSGARLGVEHIASSWTAGEWERFQAEMPQY